MENILSIFKQRLSALLDKKQDSDTAFNMKKQADQMQIPYSTFAKYVNEGDETIPGIDKLFIIAEYYNVSTDYLLGREKSRTTDTDQQAAIKYTGLSEESINTLQELSRELDINDEEKNEILQKQNTFTQSLLNGNSSAPPLSEEDQEKYLSIIQHDQNIRIIEILNYLLSIDTGHLCKKQGLSILEELYKFCKITPNATDVYTIGGESFFLNKEMWEGLVLHEINNKIRILRNIINYQDKEREKHG